MAVVRAGDSDRAVGALEASEHWHTPWLHRPWLSEAQPFGHGGAPTNAEQSSAAKPGAREHSPDRQMPCVLHIPGQGVLS